MNGLIIKNLSKSFKKYKALNNINLEIRQGMFGLLGRNGAGKTTLMKIITTLLEPDEGEVIIEGLDVKKDKLQVRKIIGFLPQEFSIYPNLTAIEFLDYIARLNNMLSKKNRHIVIRETLKKVNLYDKKDCKVGGFSGGMRRRLGIAQAIIKDPKILIVDEPTAGLDPEERIRFRTMLVELSLNKIVILSTHIVEDISASCEQMGVLDYGKLKFIGSPSEFIKKAQGCVWEKDCKSKNELLNIKDSYNVINIRQSQNNTRVRFLNSSPLEGGCILMEPNLEDAYLYFINSMKEKEEGVK